MENQCQECQHFQQCQSLFQCNGKSATCDWEPSRFIRAGRIHHHPCCNLYRGGKKCNCTASSQAKKYPGNVWGKMPRRDTMIDIIHNLDIIHNR